MYATEHDIAASPSCRRWIEGCFGRKEFKGFPMEAILEVRAKKTQGAQAQSQVQDMASGLKETRCIRAGRRTAFYASGMKFTETLSQVQGDYHCRNSPTTHDLDGVRSNRKVSQALSRGK